MPTLKHWRIEDGHFACYDIYHDEQHVSTYEVDLWVKQPPSYSWAQHIAEKNWSFDEMIFELSQLETAFSEYNYQNQGAIA